MEKIVETKVCKQCDISFEITDKDLEFYDKVSPKFNGKKYSIPTPTLCPECRQKRRLVWRNERKLYKRICDATGKPMISMYSPDKPHKIFNSEFWWSDKWAAVGYGREFDFTKGFFDQFKNLVLDIPLFSLAVITSTMEKSEFNNCSGHLKECYLLTNSDFDEKCFYGKY